MNNETFFARFSTMSLGTPCLVCGESVPIPFSSETPRICDKCKRAVMHTRRLMEEADRLKVTNDSMEVSNED